MSRRCHRMAGLSRGRTGRRLRSRQRLGGLGAVNAYTAARGSAIAARALLEVSCSCAARTGRGGWRHRGQRALGAERSGIRRPARVRSTDRRTGRTIRIWTVRPLPLRVARPVPRARRAGAFLEPYVRGRGHPEAGMLDESTLVGAEHPPGAWAWGEMGRDGDADLSTWHGAAGSVR